MSGRIPLTVDEAIEKLTKLSEAGKGEFMIVTGDWADGEQKTLHGFESALVAFESLEPRYPKNQTQTYRGERIISRGRPSGTTPVVRIY